MVAVGVIGIIAYAMGGVLMFLAKTSIVSREQTICTDLAQRFFTRLDNIPYTYVFDMDSSSTNFRLNGTFGNVSTQRSPYPYLASIREFYDYMIAHKVDRFTLDIRFMARDLGDSNGDGQVTDLRVYVDSDANNVDDYEMGLRYFNQNADSDFFDFYGSPQVTEQPHTRIKEATLKFYKSGKQIYSETRLISWEKLTGTAGEAAGANLSLIVTTPTDSSAVYSLLKASHTRSFNITLSTSYPSDVSAFHSDTYSVLHIIGETIPDSTFSWRLGTTTSTISDSCTADYLGQFDCALTVVSKQFTEGTNIIWGQAYKSSDYSPWTKTTIIRDVSTPTITNVSPQAGTTFYNRQPTVRAMLRDVPHNAGNAVAGIESSVIRLYLTTPTIPIYHEYDASTYYVTWIDSTTGLPPILSTGTYIIGLEGGDRAYYKVKSTWTITVAASSHDLTVPEIDTGSLLPMGSITNNQPTISCDIYDNESGIRLSSVTLSLNGTVVVSTYTGNFRESYSPMSGQNGISLSYIPPDALALGTHYVDVSFAHWAVSPSSTVARTYGWSFTITP